MIIEAILEINPNAVVTVKGNDINTCEIEWLENTTPISKADIEAQFTAVDFDTAIKNLRAKRNKLLAETDYLALSDQTLSDDMKTYRQELRDLPAHNNGKNAALNDDGTLKNVAWPKKPA